MNKGASELSNKWSLATEKFFYYFLGLRKGDLSRQVEMMRARYPDDSPERLARRFIAAQIPLSLVGSVLVHGPLAVPATGPLFRFLGIASGTTVMVILNMTLLLQIALAYGYDIDDRARVKELLAVIGITGFASSSAFVIPQYMALEPGPRAVAGGATMVAASQALGEAAIKYFNRSTASENAPA